MIVSLNEAPRPETPRPPGRLDVSLRTELDQLLAVFVIEPQTPEAVAELQAAIAAQVSTHEHKGLSPLQCAALVRKALTAQRRNISPWARARLGTAFGLEVAAASTPAQQSASTDAPRGSGPPPDAKPRLGLDRPDAVGARRGGFVGLLAARLGL